MPNQEHPYGAGIIDFRLTPTDDVTSQDPYAGAVGQMIQLDPRVGRAVQDDELRIRCVRLRDRKFLDSCTLSDQSSPDVRRILPYWTFLASTVVLIDRWRVLTAGHSVIEKRLGESYIVFGRTQDSALASPASDGYLHIPLDSDQVRQVARVEKIRNPAPRGTMTTIAMAPDWAILELDRPITHVNPIPLNPSVTFGELFVYSHPLGVPMQRSTATIPAPDGPRFARLICDFGAGGSGSPVITNGSVIGVVSGNARFEVADRVGSEIVVRTVDVDVTKPIPPTHLQPATLASEIHPPTTP